MRTGGQDPGVHMSSQQLQLLARSKEKDPGASLADSLAKTHELQIAERPYLKRIKLREVEENTHSPLASTYTQTAIYTHVCVHTQHTHTHHHGLLCLTKEISR